MKPQFSTKQRLNAYQSMLEEAIADDGNGLKVQYLCTSFVGKVKEFFEKDLLHHSRPDTIDTIIEIEAPEIYAQKPNNAYPCSSWWPDLDGNQRRIEALRKAIELAARSEGSVIPAMARLDIYNRMWVASVNRSNDGGLVWFLCSQFAMLCKELLENTEWLDIGKRLGVGGRNAQDEWIRINAPELAACKPDVTYSEYLWWDMDQSCNSHRIDAIEKAIKSVQQKIRK